MVASFTGLREAHRQDAEHFDSYWREMFNQGTIELLVPPDEEMWRLDLGRSLRVAFNWLGDLRGKRVLELGCGPGDYTIMMARRGAQVTALDIAPSSLEIVRARAQANGVQDSVHTTWMAAEMLAFPAQTFDWVVGFGLLHHADPAALGPELRRVLRPGGRALFREPLGTNPILEFVRNYVPYRNKHHSLNEHPLQYKHIQQIGQYFQTTHIREFYLFSMITRAVASETSFPLLWKFDEFLIEHLPAVHRWCRYVLLEYVT